MDTHVPATRSGVTFLSDCVSDGMSPAQAAEATNECWTEAEQRLVPILGVEGVQIVFREGERLAAREVGEPLGSRLPATGAAFSDWAKGLSGKKAVAACATFLASVERYLVRLLGVSALRKILKRSRSK